MECEVPLFYSHAEVVARKEHRCCECTASILPGEKHFTAVGKWVDFNNGKIRRYRQHIVCEKACEFVRDHFNDYDCIGFGELFQWIGEEAYGLKEFKGYDDGKTFRSMIAKIRRREWTGKP